MLLRVLTTACAVMGLRMHPPTMTTSPVTDSPEWPSIQGQLDALPVFTVANEDEKPLQYQVNGQPMAIFYADLLAAKKALDDAAGQNPDLNCDLISVGLGAAYTLSCQGKASLVPGVTELTACGMPEGLPAIGQELPLFACMQMTRETEDGRNVLPLFMSFDDCAETVKQAQEVNNDLGLEIVPLSLPSIVEHLSSSASESQPFEFISPTRSTEHISKYVGKGVYYRVVDED